MHRVTRARSLLDGSAESPGESLARLVFVGLGLDFRAQVDIRDAAGFAGVQAQLAPKAHRVCRVVAVATRVARVTARHTRGSPW